MMCYGVWELSGPGNRVPRGGSRDRHVMIFGCLWHHTAELVTSGSIRSYIFVLVLTDLLAYARKLPQLSERCRYARHAEYAWHASQKHVYMLNRAPLFAILLFLTCAHGFVA